MDRPQRLARRLGRPGHGARRRHGTDRAAALDGPPQRGIPPARGGRGARAGTRRESRRERRDHARTLADGRPPDRRPIRVVRPRQDLLPRRLHVHRGHGIDERNVPQRPPAAQGRAAQGRRLDSHRRHRVPLPGVTVALRIVEKAARSDVGRQRQGNEDSFLERSPLFAVADGMGGARAGEVASRIAVEQFDVDSSGDDPPEEQLAEVARGANRKIHQMAQDDSAYAGMGTTFTAALVTGKHIAVGHVGDSRLYRYRDGELERLTHDHSLVEEFVRQGKLTPAEAEVHPQRSIITRALGPEPEVEVDTYTHAGRDGDVYLLNSDGLTGMINEEKVAEILRDRDSLDDAADKLIAAANANGGKDNITVVLFRLGGDEDGDEDGDDDGDTLGGQATQVGVSTETVR